MHGRTSSASIFQELNSLEGKAVINGAGNSVDVQNGENN